VEVVVRQVQVGLQELMVHLVRVVVLVQVVQVELMERLVQVGLLVQVVQVVKTETLVVRHLNMILKQHLLQIQTQALGCYD
jgi:diphthamide synthase (EF-2-diphthine--ammonia ligase)